MTGLFLSLCSLLPLKINHLLGSFIGQLLYLFNSDAKKVTTQNISICLPDLSKIQQRELVKKALIETGKNLTSNGIAKKASGGPPGNKVIEKGKEDRD